MGYRHQVRKHIHRHLRCTKGSAVTLMPSLVQGLPPPTRDPGRPSFDSVCHGCAVGRQHCQHLGSQDARPGARAEATPGRRATSCRPLPRGDLPPPEALFRDLAVHRSPELAALKPERQGSRGRPGVRKAPSTARPRARSSRRTLLSGKKDRSGALSRGSRAYLRQYAARPATHTPVRPLVACPPRFSPGSAPFGLAAAR